jgi:hypothetical protein
VELIEYNETKVENKEIMTATKKNDNDSEEKDDEDEKLGIADSS